MELENRLSWPDPAPCSQPYPWSNLQLTDTSLNENVESTFSAMLEKGDESLTMGDYYDALWKYEHAILLLDAHPNLVTNKARALIRAAQSCLRLGETGSHSQVEHGDSDCWFYYGYQYAHNTLSHDPDPEVASKAYLRRGSCLQKLLQTQKSSKVVKSMIESLHVNSSQILCDFIKSFELDPENIEAICSAIFEATITGQTSALPSLTEEHTNASIGTKILKEIMSSSDTSSTHLRCLLIEMTAEYPDLQHFDASSMNSARVLDKKVYDVDLYEQLVKSGILITSSCLEQAIEELSEDYVDLFEFLLSECNEKELSKAQKFCEGVHRATFLEIITRKIDETIKELKKSGDTCLQNGTYREALTKYETAINFCGSHERIKANAELQISCAQTCQSMGDYNKAYDYCSKAIILDPQNPSSYYHRAEILLASLQLFLSEDIGTYKDVAKDYLQCHTLKEDVDVFCKAIVVSVNNDCSEVIPKIGVNSTPSEFYKKILPNIVDKHQLTEPILEFLLWDLPLNPKTIRYDASELEFDLILLVTSQSELIMKLIQCGMKVDESHIEMVSHSLDDYSEEDVELLEFVIKHCKKSQAYQRCLDEGCNEAMQNSEKNFVRVFVKFGAKPRPKKFMDFADQSLHADIQKEIFMNTIGCAAIPYVNPWDILHTKDIIEKLMKEAEKYTRLNLLQSAEQSYCKALRISEKTNWEVHTFLIHKNLVQLYQKMKKYHNAYVHCDYMISISPDESRGYVYCAETLKKGMADGSFTLSGPILDSYHVVSAYRTAYKFDSKISHLAEALIMASKHDKMMDAVSEDCIQLNKIKCLQLLQELIKKDCIPDVFKFLWVLWGDKKGIDYSALSMKDLFCMSQVPHDTMISQLIALGARVDNKVLVCAIKNLPYNRMDTLKLIESKCGMVDINSMCEVALYANNARFTAYYLDKGAKWPKNHVEILQQLMKADAFDGFEFMLKLFTKPMVKEVDITQFISSKLERDYKHISLLLDAGVNPNGKISSIKAVQVLKMSIHVKVDVLCILIQRGADCTDLCDQTTTPLHVATKMAIESNKTEIIQAVASSPYLNRYQIFDDKGETPIHISVCVNGNKQTSLKVLTILLELDFIDPTIANASGKLAIDLVQSNKDPRAQLIHKYLEHWENKRQLGPISNRTRTVSPFSADKNIRAEAVVSETQSISVTNVLTKRVLAPIEVLPYKSMSIDRKLSFHLDRLLKAGEDYVTDTGDTSTSTITSSHEVTEFPSKDWQKECEIIQVDRNEPIIVHGQRGTGKTTCCLCRLWNDFENEAGSSMARISDLLASAKTIPQMFITKGKSHCDSFKRSFMVKARSYSFFSDHLASENPILPDSFSEFRDSSFPVFLTARQFFILLDNSLDDGLNFFKRDSAGKLQTEMISLEYDLSNQDVLWELLETTSENGILEVLHGNVKPQKNDVEVTLEYFKHIIWPKISSDTKVEADVDPTLIWQEIQYVIKGSIQSLMNGFPLAFEDYKKVDNKMAPNFSARRELVYKLYQKYQRYLQDSNHTYDLFDESDLVLNIYQRLQNVKVIPWSIHKMYFDDAQDFTPGGLAMIISCSKCPNSAFIAFSEMPGTGHQQHAVQEYLHEMSQIVLIKMPAKDFELKDSYCSHSGIQNLSTSISDFIKMLLRESSDYALHHREFSSSILPVFLESCEEQDLLNTLNVNKQGCLSIEFGPRQIVLVRSESSKKMMPQFLKNAIVLRMDQVEGMEFDDVLIYNFFTDSKVSQESWTKVTVHMENSPKSCSSKDIFSSTELMSIHHELKSLFSAISCAKQKLWLFDSDHDKRSPMLEYWTQRELVELLSSDGITEQKRESNFPSLSMPTHWKAQGNIFRNSYLWEQAIFCYTRAGPDCLYLLKEVRAFNSIQLYLRTGDQKHLQEAAVSFLERDFLNHSINGVRIAFSCLVDLRFSAYLKVVKILEITNDLGKAAQICLKNRDSDNFTSIQERSGQFDSVLRSLNSNIFHKRKNALMRVALKKAREYESKGIVVNHKFSPEELSYSCAKFYFSLGDYSTLLDILEYMPNALLKHTVLKRAEKYEVAFKSYVAGKDFPSAYKLALGQGWFSKAILLATAEGDRSQVDKIILLEGRTCCNINAKDSSRSKRVISKLEELIQNASGVHKAEACLLLGMLQKNVEYFKMAMEEFRKEDHKAGILESFELLQDTSDQEILHVCKVAQNLCVVMRDTSDLHPDLQQTVQFYGLQFVGNSYLTSKYGHYFVSLDALLEYQHETDPTDLDGMFRIQTSAKELFAKRFESMLVQWMARFKIKAKLLTKCESFKPHLDLWKYRQLSCQYSEEIVSKHAMLKYLQDCITILDFQVMSVQGMLAHLDVIFSPGISICLPCLNSEHILAIRQSSSYLQVFEREIEKELIYLTDMKADSLKLTGKVFIDSWLRVWRLSSISYPGMKLVRVKLRDFELKVNQENWDYQPPGFVFWQSEQKFVHIFRFWLQSCAEVRDNGKALRGTKLAIVHFLGNIAESSQMSISISNITNILTIHCVSLLAMIAQASCSVRPLEFFIPTIFKNVQELFNSMNCYRDEGLEYSLFSACAQEVNAQSSSNLIMECKNILNIALSYLTGGCERAPKFCVLRYALRKYGHSDQALQCLILTLTIFGNLSLIQGDVTKYVRQLAKIFKEVATNSKEVPEYVKNILRAIKSVNIGKPSVVFKLIQDCLVVSKKEDTLCKFSFREHLSFIDVLDASKIMSDTFDYNLGRDELEDKSVDDDSNSIWYSTDGQSVDPNLVSDDVINREACFCNPCGIYLVLGDISPTDPSREQYSIHITGAAHAESCVPFNIFMSMLKNNGCLVKMAEAKIQELKDIKQSSKTDYFDYACDCLQNEVSCYYTAVAQAKLIRDWRNGILQISQYHERIDRLLKKADNLACEFKTESKKKVDVREIKSADSATSIESHSQKMEPVKKSKKKKRKANKH